MRRRKYPAARFCESGLLADISQDAAVNVQNVTVDKVGSIRSQEHSGTGQILCLTPATCGGLADDELVKRNFAKL